MSNAVEPWVWQDIDDQIDVGTKTGDDGAEILQYRQHIVLSATRLLTASEVSAWATKIGDVATSFNANIGDAVVNKTTSTGKFICIKHRIAPDKKPARFATEEIVYEMYTKWIDVPAGWGWDESP
jgi:hypothetical protein